MGTELRRRQQQAERVETLTEVARLDLARHLIRAGATPLERAAVRATLVAALQEDLERDTAAAVADGESFATVARAVGISRQAVSKRYRHLESVS